MVFLLSSLNSCNWTDKSFHYTFPVGGVIGKQGHKEKLTSTILELEFW